jgi:aryl-phospho-beta-D-glucosidase BglC (GH1 family)
MMASFAMGAAQGFVKDGSWFRDAQGRYLLFRGVNLASRSKLPPYLPVLPLEVKALDQQGLARFYQELEAVKPQLDILKMLGFNAVRLLVMWKAIEPRPNLNLDQLLPEGVQYLQLVREIMDALYERGIYVLLDFHQDIAHERYSGDGFPDWAMAVNQQQDVPQTIDLRNIHWELEYTGTLLTRYHDLVRATLQAFWHNDLTNTQVGLNNFPVRTHLEKTIGQTAKFFQSLNNGQGHPGLIGYEPFNEPHQVGIDKREFESQVLPEYYANVQREIRAAGDKTSFLFVEPCVDWNYYGLDTPELDVIDFTLKPETALDVVNLDQEHTVFSFHYYDPWTFLYSMALGIGDHMENKQREWPEVFQHMRDAATMRGLIPFLTELGGNQDWHFLKKTELRPAIYQGKQIRAYMDLLFQQVEAKLLNATYWNFDLYNTNDGKDNWNLENFSLLDATRALRHEDIIARPYPLCSSAQPESLFFDLETKHCALVLQGSVVDAPTVLYVPYSIHYAKGFDVRATSSDIEWDAQQQLLSWRPARDQPHNQLIITPAQSFDKAALPSNAQNLLPVTTAFKAFAP